MALKIMAKPSHRVRLAIIIAVSAAVLLSGLIYIQQRKTAPPAYTGPIEKVTSGFIGEYASLALIAQDQGYFKDNGLNVTIKDYPSGPAALADLYEAKIDMAGGADFAAVRNTFQGEDLKILTTMSKSETFFIVGRHDRGIKEVSDLAGKKIGITQQTVGEFYLGQFLTFNRLALGDVKLINLTQAELIEALANGNVDAAVLFEPNSYKAQSRLKNSSVRWSIQRDQDLYSLLFTTGQITREKPEIIKRYLRALVSAERFIKKEERQARTIIAERLNYDNDYMDYIWPKYTFETSLEQEMLINMEDQARWAIENRLTSATKVPNYLRLIYFDGLEAVKPEGITVIR